MIAECALAALLLTAGECACDEHKSPRAGVYAGIEEVTLVTLVDESISRKLPAIRRRAERQLLDTGLKASKEELITSSRGLLVVEIPCPSADSCIVRATFFRAVYVAAPGKKPQPYSAAIWTQLRVTTPKEAIATARAIVEAWRDDYLANTKPAAA